MAFRTPATCHSFTSRYSLSASAARNDRLRPVLFASFSNRFLTSVSTRTVNVVEDMALTLVIDCIHNNTKMRHGTNIADSTVRRKSWKPKAPVCYICGMKRDEAISRLQQHQTDLKRLGVEHLYMFGSTARDEAGDDSDVDLFLIMKKASSVCSRCWT